MGKRSSGVHLGENTAQFISTWCRKRVRATASTMGPPLTYNAVSNRRSESPSENKRGDVSSLKEWMHKKLIS